LELKEPEHFLNVLYGTAAEDIPDAKFVLWKLPDKLSKWLPVSDLSKIAKIALGLSAMNEVYFGVSLQQGPGTETERGTNEKSLGIPGLWIDIDTIDEVAHTAKNLPANIDEVNILLNEFPLKPTLIVNSGYGYHIYWLFKEFWHFENPDERKQAQELANRFKVTWKELAKRHGWKLDSVSDLARLLRLPGTWNRKKEPVQVRLLELDESNRYTIYEFEPYLLEPIAPEKKKFIVVGSSDKAPEAAILLTECQFIQYCKENSKTLPEPLWYSMVTNLAGLDGGHELIHELSKPYPKYSYEETDKKINHAHKDAPAPHTCEHIRDNGYECQKLCSVKAPAGLAYRAKSTALFPELPNQKLFTEYISLFQNMEAPEAYHFFSLATVIAMMLERKVYASYPRKLYSNLFVL